MSWNDLEIRHRGKFSYQVPVDECKVSWSVCCREKPLLLCAHSNGDGMSRLNQVNFCQVVTQVRFFDSFTNK